MGSICGIVRDWEAKQPPAPVRSIVRLDIMEPTLISPSAFDFFLLRSNEVEYTNHRMVDIFRYKLYLIDNKRIIQNNSAMLKNKLGYFSDKFVK